MQVDDFINDPTYENPSWRNASTFENSQDNEYKWITILETEDLKGLYQPTK